MLVQYSLLQPGVWVVLAVSCLLILGAVLYSRREEPAPAEFQDTIPGIAGKPVQPAVFKAPEVVEASAPSGPVNYHLYCLTYPMEALVASMLAPEEFATYLALGTRKIARGKVMFFEVAPGFKTGQFNWDKARTECVAGADSKPKSSVYLGVYRVLENVPLDAIRMLYLVTRDGRCLAVSPQRTAPAADHASRESGVYLYQELCPVRPLVASRLDPLDFGQLITGSTDGIHVPRLFFARLKLGSDPKNLVQEASLPYDNLAHIQDCVLEVLEKSKATKTVERSHPDDFFYTTIMDGFYLAEQNTGLYFPFPMESELKDKYYQWWRSAV
jgi:hypothetical protein